MSEQEQEEEIIEGIDLIVDELEAEIATTAERLGLDVEEVTDRVLTEANARLKSNG